ncbi:MAG: long-chain fatty acid--CoA ligase [Fretibacterium sp.]|nr:long-chain fatty acid--CoA ligase [Fretibacterium sp.]
MSERLEKVIGERLSKDKNTRCYWWDGNWHSAGDCLALADDCERTLKEAGFTEGQRLVVMMKNSPMIVGLSLACWRLKGAICPLNAAAGMDSLTGTLKLIDPFAVVLSNSIKKETREALEAQGYLCVTCPPDGPLPAFKGRATVPESSEMAVIFATSGTTGLPKAVPLTHSNLLDNCNRVWKAVTPLEEGDVFLNVLPNFHSFGYTAATILPLVKRMGQAIVPGFLPPQAAIKAIAEAPVTVLFAVPTIFAYLFGALDKGSLPKETFAHVKLMISGGDRLPPNLHDLAIKHLGMDVVEGYGITETSPIVAVNRNYETHRAGTVGPLLEGYEYQLRTREGEITDGNEGVLWLKGPSVTPGYFRAPELTAKRFDGPWFNSGDYVRMEDGYLSILDRVTDIIIVGGFNVYPQEVERILVSHPAVRTAIVVGEPSPSTGEIPKAFIQKQDGAEVTERDLIRFCKERLAHFKVPRDIEFVDEFPVSGTGKILRRVLREWTHKGH